jgi:hypothetical protein
VNPVIECAAWVAGIWLAIAVFAAWAKHRDAKRRARVFREVATYRAWRLAQLEQPLAERYPELDAQLDQYAASIRSLYAEGDRP